jgi:hypothetical protein
MLGPALNTSGARSPHSQGGVALGGSLGCWAFVGAIDKASLSAAHHS